MPGEPVPIQNPATVLPLAAPHDTVAAAANPVVVLPSIESVHRQAVAVTLAPTVFACLQCQLVGRRRLTCSKADACAALPHAFYLGPVLLLAWAVTAAAFIIAVL